MTRQQYQQKYGTAPTPSVSQPSSQPIKMTRAEYEQKYGQKTPSGFVGNLFKSGGKLIGDTVGAIANIFNPDMEKNTVANVAKLSTGVAQLADPTQGNKIVSKIPGLSQVQGKFGDQEQTARNVGQFYKQRYGGVQNIKDTFYNDPIGMLADVGTVVTGAGGALRATGSVASKLGSVSNASKLTQAGRVATNIGTKIDPLVVAGKGLGSVVNKSKNLFSRAGSSVNNLDDINRLKNIAQAEGVELPLSATTQNQFIRQGEALSGKGLFGGKISNRFEQAQGLSNKMLGKITNENVGDISAIRNSLGESVRGQLKTFSKGFKQKASGIYDEIETSLGSAKVKPINTQKIVAEILSQQKLSALPQGASTNLLKTLQANLKKTNSYAKLNQTRKDIGQLMKSTDSVASGQQAQLKAIYGAIQKDLDEVAQYAKKGTAEIETSLKTKQSIDAKWKEFSKLLNIQEGKQILGNAVDIEDIVPRIYKPNNVSSITRLKKFVTPQTFKELGDTLITDIVNNSLGRDGLIDPGKWVTNMKKWDQPTLKVAIGETGVQKLQSITDAIDDASFAKKQIGDSTRAYSGSQTAMLANTGIGGGSLVGSLLTLNPVPILTYLGVNAIGAGVFGSNLGRKALQSQLKLPKVPTNIPSNVYQSGRFGRMVNQAQPVQPTPENIPGLSTQTQTYQEYTPKSDLLDEIAKKQGLDVNEMRKKRLNFQRK